MMNAKMVSVFLYLFLCFSVSRSQSIVTPDLKDAVKGVHWNGKLLSGKLTKKGSADAILFDKTENDQLLWLKNFTFKNGTIEFDAKGQSGPPQSSFVGVAFRVVDKDTYDAVYFRPFNFRSPNALSKSHAVQYISQPAWPWERLRGEHPGEYEKGIEPAPDGDAWFHARIVIRNSAVKVYVNNAKAPSLVVKELSGRTDGSVGLWCFGAGEIANMKIEASK